MAIIKCKMCGGDLEVVAESRVAVCEYCGTQQTVPSADSEKKLTLFGRANRLRMACEFDKAAGVYESIVADFPEEAEAYWGLVLCKYGIEYVDDPATGKKIPTCHRSSFDSIMDDPNLEQAMENADVIAQKVYREEAKQFERIRKGILEVSSSEKPYDIFICYKETDEKGDRTLDSVLAQDLYTALTEKGYRVFFSRITLQGKLGEAYEPYIFAALNSAKVMLAVGTCYEYYNAVWVKNEWSRYLKICEADKSKHLIPCYKDLDPEDMPKEFKHLQGADLGKMGAVQDILFNMEKYIPLKKQTVKETVVVQQSAETTKLQALMERAFLFLEDGDWNAANEYCEKALDIDPKCAEGYLGKLMIDLRVKKREELADCAEPFDENANYQKTVRFADDKLRDALAGYSNAVTTRIEDARKDKILADAEQKMTWDSVKGYEAAIELLESIPGWKDADEKILACQGAIENLKKEQGLAQKKSEENAKKARKIIMIAAPIVCVIIAVIFVFVRVIIPGNKYDNALAMVENGQYAEALAIFEELCIQDHTKYGEDAAERIIPTKYLLASSEMENGNYQEAANLFEEVVKYGVTYKDSKELRIQCCLEAAKKHYANEEYSEVIKWYEKIGGYDKTAEMYVESCYNYGLELIKNKSYEMAIKYFSDTEGYKDTEDQLLAAKYGYVKANKINTNTTTYEYLKELKEIGYEDSTSIFKELYAWKATIIANDDENGKTNMSSISKYSDWYFHVELSGGEPGDSTKIKYTLTNPAGKTATDSWDNEWKNGWSGWCSWGYDNPAYGKEGKLSIKVYDGSGNLIGEHSVKITG